MADQVEQFNQHQIDVKSRYNLLAQSILLLAGGELTASIAVFTGSRTIVLTVGLANTLGFSWWSLVSSICLAVISLTAIILRDYALAEQWRIALSDESHSVDDSPRWPDKIIIASGLLSIVTFLVGFVAIAFVATSVVVA